MASSLVDNKTLRRSLEKMAEGDDAVYPRHRTELFFRFFWIIAVGVIFYANYSLLNPSALTSHAVTFVSGVLALKIWRLIPEYMDLCEEVGLLVSVEGR